MRDPIPPVPVPLRRGEEEPVVDLGAVLSALYDRASYDLRVDYRRAPEPPLVADDAAWAEAKLAGRS
jgi:RecB family exonuclease